jgi:predicted AlkP superfamily pyrophosphatase or phosphodiesterase
MYGVNSQQTRDAVHFVDSAIGLLVRTVDSLHLPVNYIFVSDHGMADLDTLHPLSLPDNVDTSQFIILSSLSIVHMYAKNSSAIIPAYKALKSGAKDYDVYLTTNTPERWHYDKKNDRYNRIGDIILVAHPPRAFKLSSRNLPAATHGFDPALPDMHASFYAWGPAFKSNYTFDGFENVHIYPLMAQILQLKITTPIDGKLKIVQPLLKSAIQKR